MAAGQVAGVFVGEAIGSAVIGSLVACVGSMGTSSTIGQEVFNEHR